MVVIFNSCQGVQLLIGVRVILDRPVRADNFSPLLIRFSFDLIVRCPRIGDPPWGVTSGWMTQRGIKRTAPTGLAIEQCSPSPQ